MITSQKEAEDVLALVRALEPSGRLGISLSTLAHRAHIAANRAESVLHRHGEYFVRIGVEQKYALNRFGPFRGYAGRIIDDVERSCTRSERRWIAAHFLSALGLLLSTGALLSLL